MRKSIVFLVAVACFALTGCFAKQTPKDWAATGGSRADATVTLSYQYVPVSEQPVVDDAQGLRTAVQRCQSWGYQDAEAFGGTTTSSQPHVDPVWGNTTMTTVSKTYQCLGRGDAAARKK